MQFLIIVTLFGSLSFGFLLDEPTIQQLTNRISMLEDRLKVVENCASNMCEIYWDQWSSWSTWSHCSGQCVGGYSHREQARTRSRSCINGEPNSQGHLPCNGSSLETDRRPCSSVELYGCLNEKNTNTSDNHDFGLVYNFMDELAQSTCAAVLTGPTHAAVIRRNCDSGKAVPCAQLCSYHGWGCIDAFHVYKNVPRLLPNHASQPDEGAPGLSMYRYFDCHYAAGNCGPNYCCCTYP